MYIIYKGILTRSPRNYKNYKPNYKTHRFQKMNHLSHDVHPINPLSVEKTLLSSAIRDNNLERIQYLLRNGYKPLPSWRSGQFFVESDTCLAAECAEIEIFRLLCLQNTFHVQETIFKIMDLNNVDFMKLVLDLVGSSNVHKNVLKHPTYFSNKSAKYFIERSEILKMLHKGGINISFMYKHVLNSVESFKVITLAGGNPHQVLSIFGDSIYDMIDKYFSFFLLFTTNDYSSRDLCKLRTSYLRALDKFVFWDNLVLYNYRRDNFIITEDDFGETVKRVSNLDDDTTRSIRGFL